MSPTAPRPGTSRRRFLAELGLFATGVALWPRFAASAPSPESDTGSRAHSPRYPISVCDWMLLKRQKLGAFALAKEIGVDGVEVDMGGLGDRPTFDSHLGDPAVKKNFLEASARSGVAISSLAMSGFYAQSFAEREGVGRMVQDCLDTMRVLGVKVAFLPLGVRGDLLKFPQLRPAIIARLKTAAAAAEQAGAVIGVETTLDAAGEVRLLDDIGSPAIRSYFNFANALQHGRDLCAELRTLGRDRICQIHCTDTDGVWLEHDPKIDLRRVKATLDDMGWSGWLVMERSRDARRVHDVRWNYGANARYLKSIFQPA